MNVFLVPGGILVWAHPEDLRTLELAESRTLPSVCSPLGIDFDWGVVLMMRT